MVRNEAKSQTAEIKLNNKEYKTFRKHFYFLLGRVK